MIATSDTHVYPVIWQDDHLVLIDQRQLPERYNIVSIHRCDDVVRSLRSGIVQGGSAMGIAAAYGLYLGATEIHTDDPTAFWERIEAIGDQFKQTRPDKAHLQWAVDTMLRVVHHSSASIEEVRAQLLAQAQAIQSEDFRLCHAIGDYGVQALPSSPAKLTVLTHCNHGALATSGYGTSLGIMRSLWQAGRLERVYAAETRPTFQGSRLTAWECVQEGIPVTVITDSMAAHCMQKGLIHAVLAGADRIAANGDTLSKIGTYSLALVAQAHNIPFVVAAPVSTVDSRVATGAGMAIAEHPPEKIYQLGDAQGALQGSQRVTSPSGAAFYNPASDITPARLIAAIVTEQGAFSPHQMGELQAK
ncbi:S-methyl-5-thioribose-1-phosphate isomerase [Nodosilinea sp. LEGE 07298]|uniref:S-methyl-5-thioribose-1-phosphate isomerase n=1 Tax=Nodosilinea sp. LEGE 07298 TaxID=2777970 RepID=UPI00187EB10A|nr:S-methyl-5-thioribose-1-phosphate isomerase [Nodosilinea sp. LEGE 07298]MBE9110754.1 S-methyl-5-thioribose-1-phosphate isomerase [Nodosilinea sp. LEGE 07298]